MASGAARFVEGWVSVAESGGREAGGGPPDLKAMNQQMIDRLLSGPAQPVPRDGYGLRVLEVRGRASGEPRRTPVGLLDHAGRPYLVCPDRTRDWPRNLAADPHCVVLGGGEHTAYIATDLDGTDAAEIVAAYLRVVTVPWAVAAFRLEPGASVATIAGQVDRMAVFALRAA